MKNKIYSVHPRLTCGSGVMVDENTARRVVQQELEQVAWCIDGSSGPGNKATAQQWGAYGAAETLTELPRRWEVEDMATGIVVERPFSINDLKKETVLYIIDGFDAEKRQLRTRRIMVADPKKWSYSGDERVWQVSGDVTSPSGLKGVAMIALDRLLRERRLALAVR